MTPRRLTEEELDNVVELSRGRGDLYEQMATELRALRLAQRTPIGRAAALAQVLPVDQEAERMVDAMMAAAVTKQGPGRKMVALSDEDREVLVLARKHLDCSTWMIHQRHDPIVAKHVEECEQVIALLDRLAGVRK